MTISTTTTKASYAGDGVTIAFAVPFVFFGADELEVIERTIATGAETAKALTTDYTVSGGNGATGTVTALAAPAASVEWHIRRATKKTQLVDYSDGLAFLGQALAPRQRGPRLEQGLRSFEEAQEALRKAAGDVGGRVKRRIKR